MDEDRERRMRGQICALRESLLDLLHMVYQRSAAYTDVSMPESDRLYRQAAAAEHREFKIARAMTALRNGSEYDSDWNEAIEAAMKIAAEDRYGRMVVNKIRSLKRESE